MPQNGRYSITPEEYNAIPPTLQRKCFSTLERLRYAEGQAQADTPLKLSNLERVYSRTNITRQSISKLKDSITPFGPHQISSGQPCPPGSAYAIANVTQEHALWFSQLPDKVKRGYFSIEEELLLSIKYQNITKKDFYQSGPFSNKSLPSLQSSSSILSSLDDVTIESISTEEAEDMDADIINAMDWMDTNPDLTLDDYHKILADSASLKPPRFSSTYSPRPSFSMFRRSETDSNISYSSSKTIEPYNNNDQSTFANASQLAHDTKPSPKNMLNEWGTGWAPAPNSTFNRKRKPARLQTVHSRQASMVSLVPKKFSPTSPSRPSTSGSPLREMSSIATLPQVENWGFRKPPVSPTQALPVAPVASIKSDAAHYLNPEARLKLRMFLASASKFDEALEFGFPSLPQQDVLSNNRPQTSQSSPHHAPSTIKPDSASVTRGSSFRTANSSTMSPSTCSPPATPASTEFFAIPYQSLPDQSSMELQDPRTRIQAQLRKLDRDPFEFSNGREMTIRMTLTRSDLRADESVLNPEKQSFSKARPSTSHAVSHDPLKLEPLRFYEEETLFPAVRQKTFSFKQFWKRN